MLTGSGVALILRVVGTPPDQPWNTDGWYVFAGVAGFSLLTKYVIKYRGSHVFNPSNIGLVVAFVVLGSTRVEPLDFWWAPLNVWMIAAYAVIIGGGLLITRRLHLLGLAATFWVTLSVGIGLLAASGHCMTANWAFAPVCGADFWRVDRDLAGGPDLPVLHDHRPEDGAGRPGRAGRLRVPRGRRQHAADGAADRRVRDEGRRCSSGLVVVCAARPLARPAGAGAEVRGRRSARLRGRGSSGGDAGVGLVRGDRCGSG